jgi:hypothetical protein
VVVAGIQTCGGVYLNREKNEEKRQRRMRKKVWGGERKGSVTVLSARVNVQREIYWCHALWKGKVSSTITELLCVA